MRTMLYRQAVGALLMLLLLRMAAAGQVSSAKDSTTGIIQGSVIDPSGAVIAGAKVTATDESSARVYSIKTDDSGVYRISSLAPGNYTLRFEMQGFKTKAKTSVVVQSQVTQVDVRLAVGSYSGPDIISGPMIAQAGPVLEPERTPLDPYPYSGGVIAGRVTGGQGGPIAQVRVTLIEESTGSRYETFSLPTGLYRLDGLLPGRYTARFEVKGFHAKTKNKVAIKAGQVTQLDTNLKAGPFPEKH